MTGRCYAPVPYARSYMDADNMRGEKTLLTADLYLNGQLLFPGARLCRCPGEEGNA
jgi:hypothetical protein